MDRSVVLSAAGAALRRVLEHLGATFIKLGQVASTRPDLLASEVIVELVKLQAVGLTQADAFGEIGLKRLKGFEAAFSTETNLAAIEEGYQ